MKIPLLHRLLRHPRMRLKLTSPPDVFRRMTSALDHPAFSVFYWFLLWLSAMALQMIEPAPQAARWLAGQRAQAAVAARIAFERPAPAPGDRGASRGAPRPVIVPAGARLVERGQVLTPDVLAVLRAHQEECARMAPLFGPGGKAAGNGILLALGVLLSAWLLRALRRGAPVANPLILLFVVIAILTLVPAKWCLVLDRLGAPWSPAISPRLLPLAMASILAAILMGPGLAVVMGFWVSYAAALFAGGDFTVFTAGLAMALVVAGLARTVRTRSKVLRLGSAAGLTGALFAAAFALAEEQSWRMLRAQAGAGFAGGLVSALAVLMLLPLLEMLFGLTTDISLLELADMEHPLLKRLAIEAAGTYHHSLMVANLAQAATASIGGNSLRVTICSYFHDIGKLGKPEFFSENIPLGANPHDDLLPSMSALVIAAHVKEGVSLALQFKLPRVVTEAIQQHHGTGLISFFYHKARLLQEQADVPGRAPADPAFKEEDFRYPGPRPRSREIAVLSLADAVEAASRSLEKNTPGHVEILVREVIRAKLKDGQLDDCDLTLREVGRVERALVFSLTNMLHGRIRYPHHAHRHQ